MSPPVAETSTIGAPPLLEGASSNNEQPYPVLFSSGKATMRYRGSLDELLYKDEAQVTLIDCTSPCRSPSHDLPNLPNLPSEDVFMFSRTPDQADHDSDAGNSHRLTEEQKAAHFKVAEEFMQNFECSNNMDFGPSHSFGEIDGSHPANLIHRIASNSGPTNSMQDSAETSHDVNVSAMQGLSKSEAHHTTQHLSNQSSDYYLHPSSDRSIHDYPFPQAESQYSTSIPLHDSNTASLVNSSHCSSGFADENAGNFGHFNSMSHCTPENMAYIEENGLNNQDFAHNQHSGSIEHTTPPIYYFQDPNPYVSGTNMNVGNLVNPYDQLNQNENQWHSPLEGGYVQTHAINNGNCSNPASQAIQLPPPSSFMPQVPHPQALLGTKLERMELYKGCHRSAREAREYTHETRRRYEVEGEDDWAAVEMNPIVYVRDIYEAMSTIVPQPDSAQVSYWNTMTRKGHDQAMLEARAWDIVHTAIVQHKHGISNFPELEINKRDVKDMSMCCSERLRRITEILYTDKLVCKDVVDGNKISYLVATPNAWITRKNDNRRLNKDKGAIMRAGKNTVHKYQNSRNMKERSSSAMDQDADFMDDMTETQAVLAGLDLPGGEVDRQVEASARANGRVTRASKKARREERTVQQAPKRSRGKRRTEEMDDDYVN